MSFLKNFDFITVFSTPETISPALEWLQASLDSFINLCRKTPSFRMESSDINGVVVLRLTHRVFDLMPHLR